MFDKFFGLYDFRKVLKLFTPLEGECTRDVFGIKRDAVFLARWRRDTHNPADCIEQAALKRLRKQEKRLQHWQGLR